MRRCLFFASFVLLFTIGIWRLYSTALAEQSGSSPESGTTSRITEGYEWLVAKGTNYGGSDAPDWSNNWGTYWNRIAEAAAWEPDGSASAAEMPTGLTFYGSQNDRTLLTGTLYLNWLFQAYDDVKCSGNNGESSSACAADQQEYTGEEGTWTLTSSGGSAASVTDNAVTATLTTNKVYRDNRTLLYWTDKTSGTLDNEFAYVNGDDRTSPTGNSCNFNSTGSANQYCDNQDPNAAYAEDNDVSAADFCLNLALDADNVDGDSDGTTGTETDWRLPSQKEAMAAYANGIENNSPVSTGLLWTSTEFATSSSTGWQANLGTGAVTNVAKNLNTNVVCVRRA